MKKVLLIAMVFGLASCAPGFRFGDSWAREIFAASEDTNRRACRTVASLKSNDFITLGQYKTKTEFGGVSIWSGTTTVSLGCNLFALFWRTNPEGEQKYLNSKSFSDFAAISPFARIFLEDQKDEKAIEVSIVLRNEEKAELKTLKPSNVYLAEGGAGNNFEKLSDAELKLLDDTAMFDVVLKKGEQKAVVSLTPSEFTAFTVTRKPL